jgi:hypothetical protein
MAGGVTGMVRVGMVGVGTMSSVQDRPFVGTKKDGKGAL